jgi:hypothetical protein
MIKNLVITVILATVLAWLVLSYLALVSRTGDVALIPALADFDKAKDWATDLLGIAATLAGLLGITAAASSSASVKAEERVLQAEGGVIGLLAGITLLGVGDWAAPIGLAALVTGVATVRAVRALREERG